MLIVWEHLCLPSEDKTKKPIKQANRKEWRAEARRDEAEVESSDLTTASTSGSTHTHGCGRAKKATANREAFISGSTQNIELKKLKSKILTQNRWIKEDRKSEPQELIGGL